MEKIIDTCIDLILEVNYNTPGNLFDEIFEILPVGRITVEDIAPGIGYDYTTPLPLVEVLVA